MGTVELNTFKEEWAEPEDKSYRIGPKLWNLKQSTNFEDGDGTWCSNGKDPIPYEIPPKTKIQWTVGESTGGIFSPRLHLYFGVGDPITGVETDCILELYQDITANWSGDKHITVTLTKNPGCDKIDAMKNNLKIKQQGIFCREMESGVHGISERWTNIGQPEGDCGSSRRLNEDNLVKTVYDTRFSVYWDPPINGSLGATASAAGFDAGFGPSAAPSETSSSPAPSSSVKRLQHGVVSNVFMALMAAVMLAFFSA